MILQIIDFVGDPINLLTCIPPKSGTTSWIRGVAVLKDYFTGIKKKLEDYIPTKLFDNRLKDSLSPSQFGKKTRSELNKFSNVTKVTVSNSTLIRNSFYIFEFF